MTSLLSDRLQAVDVSYRAHLDAYFRAFDLLVARLKDSGAGGGAPDVGEVFPGFVLPDTQGTLWNLAEKLTEGPVILTFHRGSWCPYCEETVRTLGQIEPSLKDLGCQVMAITPEGARHAKELRELSQSRFPVLCDIGFGTTTSAGLSYIVDEDFKQALQDVDVHIDQRNQDAGWILPIPATFVLNRDGIVVARFVDADPSLCMETSDILQAAEMADQSDARS